jgi:hypothetical protein
MPQLHFSIPADGLNVSAVIGLNNVGMLARLNASQPIPRPVVVPAAIDTGSTVTAIASHAFTRLGLSPLVVGSSQTAAGSVAVNLYRVSLSILDPTGAPGVALTLPDLLVSELTTPLADVDTLIGMDVLLTCKLLLDGPARRFALEY